MRHPRLPWIRCAALALAALWSGLAAAEPAYAPVAIDARGSVGSGIALFVPAPLDAADLPPSLALQKPAHLRGKLPRDWSVVPVFSSDGTHFRASVPVAPGVDLYGSGEVTGPLRRNGTAITLWNTDNFTYIRDDGHRLYQAHPWILGVRRDGTAFGVLFDTTWKSALSCGDAITFTSEGPAFPVLVIDRPSPQAVLKGLAELTGTMPLPPRWALGYQQCRWSYYPDTRVREIADGFRSRRIPCDVLWMDIDYMDGFRIFTFSKAGFPDPAGLSAYLHARGFKGVWMIDPGVKVDPAYSVYQSGGAHDAWVKTAGGRDFVGAVWPGPCVFPDFTRPKVRAWWGSLYGELTRAGVDGVWNDMNEPAVFDGPDKTMPEDNWHRGGGGLRPRPAPRVPQRLRHAHGARDARGPGRRTAGPDGRSCSRAPISWAASAMRPPGPATMRSTGADMKLSVPMTLSLGLSGQPFNGPDLGGFSGDATPELWAQWVGFGAFFPFCRGHAVKGSSEKEPWAFGPKVEQTARIALERRYRLLPYLYTPFASRRRRACR